MSEGDRGDLTDSQAIEPSASVPRRARDLARTCPNCGALLVDRACKLICPTPGCGYFLSCSDYD